MTMQSSSVGSGRNIKSNVKSISDRVMMITALFLHVRLNLTMTFGTSALRIARPTAKTRKRPMPTIYLASLALPS